ncbi:unnamed protein product [Boreogadus saida]
MAGFVLYGLCVIVFCNVSLPIPIWVTSYITQKDVCHPSLSRETQSQGVAVLMYKANTRFRMKCIFVLNKGFVSVGILQNVDLLGFSRGCFLWAKLLIWCLPISDHILYRCWCSTLRVSKCCAWFVLIFRAHAIQQCRRNYFNVYICATDAPWCHYTKCTLEGDLSTVRQNPRVVAVVVLMVLNGIPDDYG